MNVTIYGTKSCGFCTRAKDLCAKLSDTDDSFTYEYIDIHEAGYTKESLEKQLGCEVRTVPQIVVDGNHIGGYTELDALLKS